MKFKKQFPEKKTKLFWDDTIAKHPIKTFYRKLTSDLKTLFVCLWKQEAPGEMPLVPPLEFPLFGCEALWRTTLQLSSPSVPASQCLDHGAGILGDCVPTPELTCVNLSQTFH